MSRRLATSSPLRSVLMRPARVAVERAEGAPARNDRDVRRAGEPLDARTLREQRKLRGFIYVADEDRLT